MLPTRPGWPGTGSLSGHPAPWNCCRAVPALTSGPCFQPSAANPSTASSAACLDSPQLSSRPQLPKTRSPPGTPGPEIDLVPTAGGCCEQCWELSASRAPPPSAAAPCPPPPVLACPPPGGGCFLLAPLFGALCGLSSVAWTGNFCLLPHFCPRSLDTSPPEK